MRQLRTLRIANFVSIGVLVATLAIGGYLSFSSWSTYVDAQSTAIAKEDAAARADSKVSAALNALHAANAAYDDWYACWISRSWYWDWICGSGSSYQADVDMAEAQYGAAQQDAYSAASAMRDANEELDSAASAFNSAIIISSIAAAAALVGTIVFSVMQIRARRRISKQAEAEARPDWVCPSCAHENEGGLFCVSCGDPKSTLDEQQMSPANDAN